MKILIFGGSVFVGATIAADLAEAGHAVVVANRGTRPPPHPAIQQAIFDRTSVTKNQLPQADLIIDGSCYTAADAGHGLAALSNLDAPYIMISSAAVYAAPIGNRPHFEGDATPGDPIWGDYGTDKARAERVLRSALGSLLTILRPPYIYGPRNNLEREAFIWDRLISSRPILIPQDGLARLQFLHVSDLARLISTIAQSEIPGDVYNVGEEKDYSITEYVTLLGTISRQSVRLISVGKEVPARSYFPFRDSNLVLDCGKVARMFGVSFRPLDAGLRDTFEWYQKERGSALVLTDVEKKFDERPL